MAAKFSVPAMDYGRHSTFSYALIPINRKSLVPIYKQIYDAVRSAILNKQLTGGDQLPSTRALAKELNLSRNTVLIAFDQLFAEGYINGQRGSGTYVATVLPEELSSPLSTVVSSPTNLAAVRSLSKQSDKLAPLSKIFLPVLDNQNRYPGHAFQIGASDIRSFPKDIWGRLLSHHWRHTWQKLMSYHHPAGYQPLRSAIASYLAAARGVKCVADQIIIVTGSQQALSLTAQVLLNVGDKVWLEEPGYLGARAALSGRGADIVPIPIDREGIDVAAGQLICPEARLAFVTPSHQFPLGITMSLARRLALLEWANRASSWILEDDYDSEFRYSTRPLAALQGLDEKNRVIYSGTFSKVMFPGLRLGYLVVPGDLVEAFTAARLFADMHSPVLEQAVLADFIEEGHFERHIRRMRQLYGQKQELLLNASREQMAGILDVQPSDAGMHLVGWLPRGVNDVYASKLASEKDVDVAPLSYYAINPVDRGALLLGYAGVEESEILDGVRRLANGLALILRSSGIR